MNYTITKCKFEHIWDLKIEFIDGTIKELNHGILGTNLEKTSIDELIYDMGGIKIIEHCCTPDDGTCRSAYDNILFYPYNIIKNMTYTNTTGIYNE